MSISQQCIEGAIYGGNFIKGFNHYLPAEINSLSASLNLMSEDQRYAYLEANCKAVERLCESFSEKTGYEISESLVFTISALSAAACLLCVYYPRYPTNVAFRTTRNVLSLGSNSSDQLMENLLYGLLKLSYAINNKVPGIINLRSFIAGMIISPPKSICSAVTVVNRAEILADNFPQTWANIMNAKTPPPPGGLGYFQRAFSSIYSLFTNLTNRQSPQSNANQPSAIEASPEAAPPANNHNPQVRLEQTMLEAIADCANDARGILTQFITSRSAPEKIMIDAGTAYAGIHIARRIFKA